MRRFRQIFKALFVSLTLAMLVVGPVGCGDSDEKKLPDKVPTEHPTEHPE
jgi:hypothetical protein